MRASRTPSGLSCLILPSCGPPTGDCTVSPSAAFYDPVFPQSPEAMLRSSPDTMLWNDREGIRNNNKSIS